MFKNPVCAEVEIGLGVPRDSVRIILQEGEKRLIQSKIERDISDLMNRFANEFLDSLSKIDGFILKSKSPSCGTISTRYYSGIQKGASVKETGPGFFGEAVIEEFPMYPIETGGRLRNFRIREHWLTKLYAHARFNRIRKKFSIGDLIDYHTRHKFILMAYDQVGMRKLGKLVGNQAQLDDDLLFDKYEQKLKELLLTPPKYTSNINVLMHALGYFKRHLSHKEKAYFLDILEQYRSGWVPLFLPISILESWIVRFDEEYLQNQYFFNPYPEELIKFDLKDTWRGRDYWQHKE